uniref:Uncharacterized protein n=1 Tax=Pectinophora gossypiella TaxID=13191 RepID=A0A1E1WKG2_PECGO
MAEGDIVGAGARTHRRLCLKTLPGTTDSNQDEEEPPPLPQKSSHRLDNTLDSENNNTELPLPPRYNYDTVFSPRGSFLYNSIAQRRHTAGVDKPPTPPPKKKHVNNS